MKPLEYQLKQVKRLLSRTKTDYAVIGGIAVSVYGEPRLTFDIDITIILNNDKIGLFMDNLKRYGFSPIPKDIKRFIEKTGVIPAVFSKNRIKGRCDFIIAQNTLEYLTVKRARIKKIYSIPMKLISPEDLVIHKIASRRPRDLEDARGVLIKQRKKLNLKYIELWVKKIAALNRKSELLTAFRTLLKTSF